MITQGPITVGEARYLKNTFQEKLEERRPVMTWGIYNYLGSFKIKGTLPVFSSGCAEYQQPLKSFQKFLELKNFCLTYRKATELTVSWVEI